MRFAYIPQKVYLYRIKDKKIQFEEFCTHQYKSVHEWYGRGYQVANIYISKGNVFPITIDKSFIYRKNQINKIYLKRPQILTR